MINACKNFGLIEKLAQKKFYFDAKQLGKRIKAKREAKIASSAPPHISRWGKFWRAKKPIKVKKMGLLRRPF